MECKPKVTNAFNYNFLSPLCIKHITCADLKGDEIKQVPQIHALLLAPLPDDTVKTCSSIMKALEQKKKSPLVYIAESLGLMPDHLYEQQSHSFTKLCWAQSDSNYLGLLSALHYPYCVHIQLYSVSAFHCQLLTNYPH